MADRLRNLAETHPDLLTRECECGSFCPFCPACASIGDLDGRRLLTLEEALDALVEKEVGRVPRTTRRLGMYRVMHRLSEAVYDSPDRDARHQPREAAFWLLVEVSNG